MENEDSAWHVLPEPENDQSKPTSGLTIARLPSVKPFEAQFGALNKSTVPAGLSDYLFPDDAQSASTKTLYTYAILDAASVPDTPQILAALSVPCASILQTTKAESEASPWLARLERDGPLTRRIFTKGKLGGHLWGRLPLFFIRSGSDIAELSAHLRKFIWLHDENQRAFFFRFWEIDYLAAWLDRDDYNRTSEFFSPIETVLGQNYREEFLKVSVERAQRNATNGGPQLDQHDQSTFKYWKMKKFSAQIVSWLRATYQPPAINDQYDFVEAAVGEGARLLRTDSAVALSHYAAACWLNGALLADSATWAEMAPQMATAAPEKVAEAMHQQSLSKHQQKGSV